MNKHKVRLNHRTSVVRNSKLEFLYDPREMTLLSAEIEVDFFLDKLAEFIELNKPDGIDVRY